MSDSTQVICPHCGGINRLPEGRLGEGPKCGKCRRGLFTAQPVNLDERSFRRYLEHSGVPFLVDFWAPWCGPCRSMAPAYEKAAAMLEPRLKLVKINTEDNQSIAAQFGIRSIPTLALFRAGREVARVSGAMDAQSLVTWVRQHI